MHDPDRPIGRSEDARAVREELARLCRRHEGDLRLADDGGDVDVRLRRILDEYERRLAQSAAEDTLATLLRALATLAHKINNPLTALLGRAQLLSASSGDDPRVRKSAEVIDEAGRRIARWVHELALVVRTGDVARLEAALSDGAPPEPRRDERA